MEKEEIAALMEDRDLLRQTLVDKDKVIVSQAVEILKLKETINVMIENSTKKEVNP